MVRDTGTGEVWWNVDGGELLKLISTQQSRKCV